MKKYFFSIVILALALQACNTYRYDKARKTEPGPPGTIWLTGNKYIDNTEVRNIDWKEYLSFLENKFGRDSKEFKAAMPDTLLWATDTVNGNPGMISLYLQNFEFNSYPVVGVSYEQVNEYCKWRTESVTENFFKNKKNGPKKIIYRLPTSEEWEIAASAALSYKNFPWGYENLLDKYNFPKVICSEYNTFFARDRSYPPLFPAVSRFPNRFGLHNMCGNAAEMTDKKGIAKGGSFAHSLKECRILKSVTYTKPECWLGFRCVCEILE
ncbi:MAG: SUMF1/EgtB/PvdO family nonheme iron enzyme [Bacteroidota bacterium]